MSRHPNRCHLCGGNYGHNRGCTLEDLNLKPEQESAIRSDPGNVSEFDVECILHEIDHLRTELKESQWLTKNAVDELAALKETHANCETEISLRALTIQKKNNEIDRVREDRNEVFRNAVDAMKAKEVELDDLRAELAEANRCWHGAIEVQAELEAEIVSLRTMAVNLRLERAHE